MKVLKTMKAKIRSTGAKGHTVGKLLAFLFVAILLLSIAPTAIAGWDYYRVIEIDNSKVSGSQDLSSFPVLINLSGDWLKRADSEDHVRRADGYDIVFTDADNTTLLAYEIEKYNGTAGTLVAWVRIPTLKHTAPNTTIRLWYGNSQATDWSNPTGVWDTNYKMVQHLEESCDSSGCIKDSTSNNNDGTPYNNTTITDLYTSSGKMNGADDFDGSYDHVKVPETTSLDISETITILTFKDS